MVPLRLIHENRGLEQDDEPDRLPLGTDDHLDRLGLTYEHVIDGAAAVDAALADDFDVVLMDVSMPNLDGLEATRILRQRGYTKPVVAMTAHALKGDRDHAFKIGLSGYLTKPIRPNALRSELVTWLTAAPEAEAPAHITHTAKEPTMTALE